MTDERGESGLAGVGAGKRDSSSVQLQEPGKMWSGLALGDSAQRLSTVPFGIIDTAQSWPFVFF